MMKRSGRYVQRNVLGISLVEVKEGKHGGWRGLQREAMLVSRVLRIEY